MSAAATDPGERPEASQAPASRREAAFVLALVAAATLAPLVWHLAQGRTLAWFDAATFYAPIRPLVADALRGLELPLWNRFVAGGMPLLGEGAHGALHPLSVLVAFVTREGIDLLLVGHLLAASTGAAVLARVLGASGSSSAAAGIGFGLSGFALSMTAQLNCLGALGGMPWAVAGMVRFARAPGPGTLVAGALAPAACALAGDPQGMLAALALGLALARSEAGWRGLARAGWAALAGLGIAAVQLVPLRALAGASTRARGLRPEELASWSLSPWRLVELAVPGLFVWPEEGWLSPVVRALDPASGTGLTFAASIFVGVAMIAGATAGTRGSARGRALAIAAAVLSWLALGPLLGAQQASRLLPVVGAFRYPEKWLGGATLCLAVLAALGFDRWRADRAAARRATRVALAAAAAAIAAIAVVRGTGPWEATPGDALRLHVQRGLPHAVLGALALAGAAALCARGHRAAAPALVAVVWLEAISAAPFALRPGEAGARLATPALEALARAERPRVLSFYDATPATGERFWDDVTARMSAVAAVNLNVRQRIDHLGFYSGLEPERFGTLRATLPLEWPRIARRFGATHLVAATMGPGGRPMLPPRALDGGVEVLRDARLGVAVVAVPHRPWASFAPAVITAGDPRDALELLAEADAADAPAVVVEGEGAFPTSPGRVLSTSRRGAALRVEAEADGPATLVVSEAFWPGWKATVDGVPTPIYAADVLVRAVRFPPGRHVLEMRFEPEDVTWGLAISGASVAAVVVAAVWLRRRRSAPRGGAVT